VEIDADKIVTDSFCGDLGGFTRPAVYHAFKVCQTGAISIFHGFTGPPPQSERVVKPSRVRLRSIAGGAGCCCGGCGRSVAFRGLIRSACARARMFKYCTKSGSTTTTASGITSRVKSPLNSVRRPSRVMLAL